MSFKAPLIETDRLKLTWPTSDQVDQYYNDIIGTNMFDTIHWDGPEGPHELHDYWKMNFQQDPINLTVDFNIAVINKESNECMGGASLRPVNGDPTQIDIGYAFAPKFHSNGFGTETVFALVNEAFLNRKAERIFANIFVGNIASKRILEKTGFQLEGIVRRNTLKRGEWLDGWLMAITRPDWEKSS